MAVLLAPMTMAIDTMKKQAQKPSTVSHVILLHARARAHALSFLLSLLSSLSLSVLFNKNMIHRC